eukprot:TRINITY_DN621_c1_g1_i10.p1 TRINITY_DN621_c1_g1~~TRINITY_DN621_c1_g1_i10.p1  ORF type:complete len:326 (-),score=89.28 TRINITY_DN621_c1_g1_i10:249-1226(-)
MFCIIMLAGLLSLSQGNVPPTEKKIESTFVGEVVDCFGTSVSVVVDDAFVQVDDSALVEAIAQSVATAQTSKDSAVAEATSIGRKILEVTAKATGKVTADINSPAPGCWAIGFGRAQAVAIATAVVDAIASAFSAALSPEVFTSAIAKTKTREQDIQQAVQQVVLLLAAGDGRGKDFKQAEVTVIAKAQAINCALAEAYGEIFQGTQAEASAIAIAGCPQGRAETLPGLIPRAVGSQLEACACVSKSFERLTPAGCGIWGGADSICYVKDPSLCWCAQSSSILSGEKWRFCDASLADMKKLLNFDDLPNDIIKTGEGFGYCPLQN